MSCPLVQNPIIFSNFFFFYFCFDLASSTIGKHASTAGACPVLHAWRNSHMILKEPIDNPTTTPASIIHLHTGGSRLTIATNVATPNVTLHDVTSRFRVACIRAILYKGASTKFKTLLPWGVPMTKVKLRLTTKGLNLQ